MADLNGVNIRKGRIGWDFFAYLCKNKAEVVIGLSTAFISCYLLNGFY